MDLSLTRVPRSTRGRPELLPVVWSAPVGIPGKATVRKGPTPDSTLDVFADCDGAQGPDSTSLIPCRGVGGELLRSEQMSSKSSSSAGPRSGLLLKVSLFLAMVPSVDTPMLVSFWLLLCVPWTIRKTTTGSCEHHTTQRALNNVDTDWSLVGGSGACSTIRTPRGHGETVNGSSAKPVVRNHPSSQTRKPDEKLKEMGDVVLILEYVQNNELSTLLMGPKYDRTPSTRVVSGRGSKCDDEEARFCHVL